MESARNSHDLLKQRFDEAVSYVSQSDANYTTIDKLKLYSFYKQATEGDCNRPKPSKLNVVRFTKWKAWNVLKGASREECMKQYLDVIIEKEPHLKPLFDYTDTDQNMLGTLTTKEMLNLPKLNFNKLSDRNKKIGFREATRISHAVGVNPFAGKEEDPKRIELYDRVRMFYEKYNPDFLRDGIGHIVDFGIEFGEQELNKKLFSTYKKDLNTLDEENARITRILVERENKYETEQKKEIDEEQDIDRKSLRKKLLSFFKQVDPSRLEKSFDDLLNFVDENGVDELNLKLYDKYGEDLDSQGGANKAKSKVETLKKNSTNKNTYKTARKQHNKRGSDSESAKNINDTLTGKKGKHQHGKKRRNKAMSPTGATPPVPGLNESRKYLSPKGSTPPVPGNSSQGILSPKNKTPSYPPGLGPVPAAVEPVALGREDRGGSDINVDNPLPSNAYDMLVCYYAKYEPKRTIDGGVDSVFSWAQRNGYDKLNRELKRRFNESLREFIARSELLRDELDTFYAKYDERMLVEKEKGIDRVFQWALRNGRSNLNKKLYERYNAHLDTGNVRLSPSNAEMYF